MRYIFTVKDVEACRPLIARPRKSVAPNRSNAIPEYFGVYLRGSSDFPCLAWRDAKRRQILLTSLCLSRVRFSSGGGRKCYTVHGSNFEVPKHYNLVKAVGYGAYGLVCSAVNTETQEKVCQRLVE